jgi:hypothetical protein
MVENRGCEAMIELSCRLVLTKDPVISGLPKLLSCSGSVAA